MKFISSFILIFLLLSSSCGKKNGTSLSSFSANKKIETIDSTTKDSSLPLLKSAEKVIFTVDQRKNQVKNHLDVEFALTKSRYQKEIFNSLSPFSWKLNIFDSLSYFNLGEVKESCEIELKANIEGADQKTKYYLYTPKSNMKIDLYVIDSELEKTFTTGRLSFEQCLNIHKNFNDLFFVLDINIDIKKNIFIDKNSLSYDSNNNNYNDFINYKGIRIYFNQDYEVTQKIIESNFNIDKTKTVEFDLNRNIFLRIQLNESKPVLATRLIEAAMLMSRDSHKCTIKKESIMDKRYEMIDIKKSHLLSGLIEISGNFKTDELNYKIDRGYIYLSLYNIDNYLLVNNFDSEVSMVKVTAKSDYSDCHQRYPGFVDGQFWPTTYDYRLLSINEEEFIKERTLLIDQIIF